MALKEALGEVAERVEAALDQYLKGLDAPPRLVEAMAYSLLGGGKRLRPYLVLKAAELAGGEAETALPAACAVEMVHTYSLIHDDLPAMDDDDLRRGRPTNHKVFGEAMAILAGDALLTLAFEVMAGLARDPRVGPDRTARAVLELSRAAGAAGMVGGQVLDLAWEGRQAGPEDLVQIHSRKTGALFAGSLRIGALVAGAGGEVMAALTAYARHFGMAFQIQDDILDVVGQTEQLGKPVGSDERHRKSTYVTLYGLAGARERARQEAAQAVQALAPLGEKAQGLVELIEFVVHRER